MLGQLLLVETKLLTLSKCIVIMPPKPSGKTIEMSSKAQEAIRNPNARKQKKRFVIFFVFVICFFQCRQSITNSDFFYIPRESLKFSNGLLSLDLFYQEFYANKRILTSDTFWVSAMPRVPSIQ